MVLRSMILSALAFALGSAPRLACSAPLGDSSRAMAAQAEARKAKAALDDIFRKYATAPAGTLPHLSTITPKIEAIALGAFEKIEGMIAGNEDPLAKKIRSIVDKAGRDVEKIMKSYGGPHESYSGSHPASHMDFHAGFDAFQVLNRALHEIGQL